MVCELIGWWKGERVDENTGESIGLDTGVELSMERSLRGALPTEASATFLPTTLSWGAVSLDGEGTLPVALVTWPGHAPAARIDGATGTTAIPVVPVAARTGTGAVAPAAAGGSGTSAVHAVPT
jgi:hypothetical protein